LELVELLHLEEEQEIVLEEGAVAWVHVDPLFIGDLSEVIVSDALQDHAQVAEDIIVVRGQVQSLEVHDGSLLKLSLLVQDVGEVVQSLCILRVHLLDDRFQERDSFLEVSQLLVHHSLVKQGSCIP